MDTQVTRTILVLRLLSRLITPVSLPFSLSSSGSTATLGDGGGLFLLRRSSARNGATVAAPTMAPPVLPFPGEAEHSGGSANGPFQLARQDRESFPPLVLMMQGSSDGAGISGRFNRSTVAAAQRRTVAASPSDCSSSWRIEDEGRL
nr:hypothetical protein Iba_chr02dCG4840 [Ipomoea batatas]